MPLSLPLLPAISGVAVTLKQALAVILGEPSVAFDTAFSWKLFEIVLVRELALFARSP